jgi:endonuclease-8
VWSPQGRFAEEAALLDGGRLEAVDAVGKHLLYRWADAPSVHVHLGLFGKFTMGPCVTPSPNARLAWESSTHVVSLSGPTICEFIDPVDEAALFDRLGPDPLARRDDDLERLTSTLSRRSIPIGAALLDQRVAAGVGNVYRAEILFLAGIDPAIPSKRLTPEEIAALWKVTTEQLAIGERIGWIVTVDPAEVGAPSAAKVPRGYRTYVYKRKGKPCRRCGTGIRSTEIAGRTIWWCPSCQPSAAGCGLRP